jgi:hypothetical protein
MHPGEFELKRLVIVAVLAAAGLVTAWSFANSQVIHDDSCRKACYEQKARCVTACGQRGNAIECEERCSDELVDCTRECG